MDIMKNQLISNKVNKTDTFRFIQDLDLFLCHFRLIKPLGTY